MIKILYVIIAIFMLGFIVTIHEFGHYLVGRICGIGIVEFSIGMGPKLFGFQRKGIQYSIRAIPIGGYCAFVGEDEKNDDPRAMNNQPVWKRFLTVAAGPVMNFVLGYLFCAILLSNFILAEYLPRISYIYEDTAAATCGIELGDVITEINGTPISFDEDGVMAAKEALDAIDPEDEIYLTLNRGGETVELSVKRTLVTDEASGTATYMLGIAFGGRTYTCLEALQSSCKYMVDFTATMLKSLKDLIFRGTGAGDVMGPVGIISFVSDQVYDQKLYALVYWIFILSLNIGIMNLLPLPALDGGRLVFLIVEAIRRKPVPPEKEGMVHAIGLGLLFLLIIAITFKDVVRLFTGG